jgi:PAS domain S-box-containing protein
MPHSPASPSDTEKLGASEARLALALAASHTGIWQWNVVTDEIIWSAELLDVWGITDFAGTLEAFRERVHADDIERIMAAVRQALERGELYAEEFRTIGEDGQLRWVSDLGKGFYGPDGKALHMLGTTTDITARKQAEELLRQAIIRAENSERESQDLLSKLNEAQASTRIGSWDWSLSTGTVWWSDELYRIFDVSPASFVPRFKSIVERVHGDDREAYQMERRRLKSEGGNLDQELRILAGGVVKTCRARAVLEYDAGGQPGRYFGTFQDITEQKQLEVMQVNLRQQLLRAQKMEALGELTGGVAHDFNNILASILGYTSLALERHVPVSEIKLGEYLRAVRAAGERGRDLVDKMMKFSRQSPPDVPHYVDPGAGIVETEHMLTSLLPSTITIECVLPPSGPLIAAPAGELQQILLNLGINARDAIEGHGNIRFELHPPREHRGTCASCHEEIRGEYVEIAVRDSGAGIAAAIMTRIFDPFFTTKAIGKGSGLGLSIVHGIVHQAGGHILLDAALGAGTAFRLLFKPLAPPLAVMADSSRVMPPVKPRRALHILVVDDDVSIVGYLKEMLEADGHTVDAYTESAAALAAFSAARDHFDAMITDQTMPGLTGTELCHAMHALRADLPVVVCSGYADIAANSLGGTAERCRFLAKPVDGLVLLDTLRALVEA